ncbi:MAG: aminoacyl-tRNA hydrolase [Synergistaceae bacterium]|nr:aminoacyl-tRNA hydrolase [Synergistaceae bacterium]MBQ3758270.1 aminoacyl-tRNA hydrolase [Synergistaceae bacterium]MBQ6981569.1 aminoacyl-tRNA hydrolase [Synergistaceae bacterium]MBR0184606.1 aminoacyl-tRNA hydrolase [Synergistaceae bacterium]MBR0249318.1 aminoacyl-tRNA hydrolase [Synergistaceae bacterium]
MRLIAGLGNPGEQYAFTRHNMGWLCVDFLAVNNDLGRPQEKFHGEFWKWNDVILLKPLTFMNSSGISVSEAVNFYKIDFSDILIIYDDMALPFGKLRMRAQGSAGGHNGLTSILGALGDLHVPRLRIGIGKAPSSMINYVLGHFNPDEREKLPEIINRAGEAVTAWLNNDIQKAMTIVNAEHEQPV